METDCAALNAVQPVVYPVDFQPVVVRNHKFLIALAQCGGVLSIFLAAGMLFMAFASVLSLLHHSSLYRVQGALAIGWMLLTCCFAAIGPEIWRLGDRMAFAEAKLDGRGIDFRLGTKKSPQALFLAWDQVALIQHTRVGANQFYSIFGRDKSYVQYTSCTFFPPQKLAQLIASQAGLSIQEV